MNCTECNTPLIRLHYAQAHECPECMGKERDALYTKIERLEIVVCEWTKQQGHNQCWYYPEIFSKITDILELNIRIEPNELTKEEFALGCERFQEEKFGR